MKRYVCSVCGYIYDEAAGIPEQGIASGTKWEDLPADWTCPLCGAAKDEFNGQSDPVVSTVQSSAPQQINDEGMRELSFGELSALCSNLAKGCEKQYRLEEAGLFALLADYFKSVSKPAEVRRFETLATLIQQDLENGYPQASRTAADQVDRGALRALVWGEKVTKILSSLLNRYEKQQEALLEKTNIYFCEICGFVYIGDEPPEICPVCKVPNMKIRRIEKEAV